MTRAIPLVWLFLVGCAASPPPAADACAGDGALSSCARPTMSDSHYIAQSHAYFDSMDTEPYGDIAPRYAEQVARWEWPPWLKLTAYTRPDILAADALLALYPSTVPERVCEAFDTQPFGRCYVVFYYEAHEGRSCPIYEEFTFNDDGEITFIEAWSDLDGQRPMAEGDRWAEGPNSRLSDRVPGLGRPDGRIDLDSPAMSAAVKADPDVADFVARARDWQTAWQEALLAGGDTMWDEGCGW